MDDLIVFSVFEITQHLKQVVETQIEPLYVRGEVSNYTRHSSGHIYFNLKDANATLRCTFFRFANLHLDFEPEEGMEVVCLGKLTVYEKGGTYNLNVQSMSLAGKGDLALRFEQLKKKLQAEGLFDPTIKKPLPRYPELIGIITSPTGAALQDIINILKRRYPARVEVFPAQVQGQEAPAQLIAGLKHFNSEARADVIILTRGGGSQEDLFCFNDEALAREIFASRIPVISAVGHEIDFTIADFVADLRAPTPSAAAELAVPDKKELLTYLNSMGEAMRLKLAHRAGESRKLLSDLQYRLSRYHPEKLWQYLQLRLDTAEMELIRSSGKLQATLHSSELRQALALNSMRAIALEALVAQRQRLRELGQTLALEAKTVKVETRNRLEKLEIQLNALSPYAILNQGYCLLMREDKVLPSIASFAEEEELSLRMRDGVAGVRITGKNPFPGEDAKF